jgi:transcriptional regulator with XRE-family HTH domain
MIGSAGQQVASNVRLLREARRMSTVKLSELLEESGRPIPATGITRLEGGTRRVDVDELMALASVFGVRPEALWAPPAECDTCRGAPPPGFICAACSGLTTA